MAKKKKEEPNETDSQVKKPEITAQKLGMVLTSNVASTLARIAYIEKKKELEKNPPKIPELTEDQKRVQELIDSNKKGRKKTKKPGETPIVHSQEKDMNSEGLFVSLKNSREKYRQEEIKNRLDTLKKQTETLIQELDNKKTQEALFKHRFQVQSITSLLNKYVIVDKDQFYMEVKS